MEPKFKFEKLNIWKKAMSFGEEMNELAKKFPEIEKFNLSSQIRRAADSIALNIAEGSILQSVPQFRKFMGYSIRSLAEVVTCLHKAKRRKKGVYNLEVIIFTVEWTPYFSRMGKAFS